MQKEIVEQVYINKELEPILEEVYDPEIPVISVLDLGMIRYAGLEGQRVKVKITPTYSGCPATDMIASDVKMALERAGYLTEIEIILAPAWSSEWITEKGLKALEEYGVAPPMDATSDKKALMGEKEVVKCTNCGSTNTEVISQFGSTACKALFKCLDCHEPFEYFKCLI